MTRDETKAILKILKIAYPHNFTSLNKEDAEVMIDLWTYQFHDSTYQEVMMSVQKHIATNTYLPSIQQIKQNIEKPQITAEDTWHKKYGYGTETIYYDDDFLDCVIWKEVPKDIQDRMEYHCNPKDYAKHNRLANLIRDSFGNGTAKIYTDEDTEFIKGKMTTWGYGVAVI